VGQASPAPPESQCSKAWDQIQITPREVVPISALLALCWRSVGAFGAFVALLTLYSCYVAIVGALLALCWHSFDALLAPFSATLTLKSQFFSLAI
jgi:hypothetical protein